MERFISFSLWLLLTPLVVFAVVTDAGPLYLVVPALAAALLVGALTMVREWSVVVGVVLQRLLMTVPLVLLVALCVYAGATLPIVPWIGWAIGVVAMFTLVVELVAEPAEQHTIRGIVRT